MVLMSLIALPLVAKAIADESWGPKSGETPDEWITTMTPLEVDDNTAWCKILKENGEALSPSCTLLLEIEAAAKEAAEKEAERKAKNKLKRQTTWSTKDEIKLDLLNEEIDECYVFNDCNPGWLARMEKKQAKLIAKRDAIVNVLIPPAPTVTVEADLSIVEAEVASVEDEISSVETEVASVEAEVASVDATTDDNEDIAVDVDIPVSTESRLREVLPKSTIKAFQAILADFGWSGREFDLETLDDQDMAQLRSTLANRKDGDLIAFMIGLNIEP